MTMPPWLRKVVLTTHVVSSVGSLGAVAAFLVLAIIAVSNPDLDVVRAAYIANEVIAWYLIVPSILAALVTGLVQSLGTPWGLFRYYWVLIKLLLTIATVYVLLQQMEGISLVAAAASAIGFLDADPAGLRSSFVLHAGGGVVVLLLATVLSIYKPRGMTRYGWRKLREQLPANGS